MTAIYFQSAAEFRDWLARNHEHQPEVLVGYYKVSTGLQSMTWPESVDQALCFGWIDGVRKRVNDDRYTIRFTPRRAGSIWSAVNIRRFQELEQAGLVEAAGLEAFRGRDEAKTRLYSYENQPESLDEDLEQRFQANSTAREFFQAQPPFYCKAALFWVMSAKKSETRRRRLNALIDDSEPGRRLEQLSSPKSK